MIRRALLHLLVWCLRVLGADLLVLPPEVIRILPAVRAVVQAAERLTFVSSEYKHAHVFATCVKRVPAHHRRSIGLAIEVVLQQGLD